MVRHDFVFTNTGDAVLEITEVRTGCQCTTTGTWSRRVEPGQTGSIPIVFNSANYGGPFQRSVTVICNATNQPAVVLNVVGTIWKPIDVNPLYLYFNVVSDLQTNEVKTVRILNNDSNDVSISDVAVNNRSFSAELKTIRPGREYEVPVRVVPPLPAGTVQASLTFKTSQTNLPVVSVSVIAIVQPPLLAMPAQLMVPAGPLAASTRLGVTVRNNAATNVTVSEPAVNLPGVDIQMQELQAGRIYNLILTFPTNFQMTAGQRGELTVKTSHAQYPELKVPVYQMARPAYQQPFVSPRVGPTNQVRPVGPTASVVRPPAAVGPRLMSTNQVRPPPLPPRQPATNQVRPSPPAQVRAVAR
jgi:hypothetical protein